ncbi:MAG: DUF2141 domain-containing protein [Saprospiraceae bacterium]
MQIAFFLLISWMNILPQSDANSGTLVLEVNNLQQADGTIYIAIYKGKENFLNEDKAILRSQKVNKKGTLEINLDNLEYGDYALAIFHDLNANKELDTNLVGIPKEPFGFSKPMVSKFREPRYEEVRIDFKKSGQKISSSLQTFW